MMWKRNERLGSTTAHACLRAGVGLLVALCLVTGGVMVAYASGPPPMPHAFVGTVTIGATLAPEGMVVQAYLDGEWAAEATIDDEGGYDLTVPGPGDVVTFLVGTVWANETAEWEEGGGLDDEYNIVEFDLTVSAHIAGVVAGVDCTALPGVTVTVHLNDEPVVELVSGIGGHYFLLVGETGHHRVVASKEGFGEETRCVNIEGVDEEHELDFRGNHGLIPNAPDLFYVLDCIDLWLYPPGEECGLSLFRVLDVIDAWLYPVDTE